MTVGGGPVEAQAKALEAQVSERTLEIRAQAARETELRGLMDKASEGGGGFVIGSLAYRTDYDAARSDEKLLLRIAAEKNCGFNPSLQSDQIIR